MGKLPKKTVMLIGCGKMGMAMLEGWLADDQFSPHHYICIDPYASDDLVRHTQNDTQSVKHYTQIADAASALGESKPDIVILAVKPQIMAESCEALKSFLERQGHQENILQTVFISIAAGKTISFFEQYFGAHAPIIRVMPNTPASIGRGMLVQCGNKAVGQDILNVSEAMMSSLGQCATITDESDMDAVTAVSGSGPAYIFYLTEVMTECGVEMGLDQDLAARLARETVIGAAALMAHEGDTQPSNLREAVTSPGGTTQAALEVLMRDKDGLKDVMVEALSAAQKRSKELS